MNRSSHHPQVPPERLAGNIRGDRLQGELSRTNDGDAADSSPSREDWIDHWRRHRWRTSGRKTKYENIAGYNVLYMPDHNDPEVWTYRITLEGNSSALSDGWSTQKYSHADEAKRASLERLADLLGKKSSVDTC